MLVMFPTLAVSSLGATIHIDAELWHKYHVASDASDKLIEESMINSTSLLWSRTQQDRPLDFTAEMLT